MVYFTIPTTHVLAERIRSLPLLRPVWGLVDGGGGVRSALTMKTTRKLFCAF